MVLAGDVLPEQLGAFLMLLRMKEESAEEIAGFARAVRKTLPAPEPGLVAVDWSSYAGKKRQLPWFLLAALCLVQAGHSVSCTDSTATPRAGFTRRGSHRAGLPVARISLGHPGAAAKPLRLHGPAAISPPLARMMGFKPILGLRSPIHTLARMINPLARRCCRRAFSIPIT